MMEKFDKIFVFGYYGQNNAGDDSMLYGFFNSIKYRRENKKISFYILSKNKLILPKINSVKVFLIKPKFSDVLSTIVNSDAILIIGGSHIEEQGKIWRSHKNIIRIFLITLIAKILNKKFYLIANGFGPIKSKINYLIGAKILKYINYISLRDTRSYVFCKNLIKEEKKIGLSFDLALKTSEDLKKKKEERKNNKIIGISLLSYYKIYEKDSKEDENLINSLSSLLNQIAFKNYNVKFYLYEFHGPGLSSDLPILLKLEKKIKKPTTIIRYSNHPEIFLKNIDRSDFFISMRYHSCLFAYLRNIPFLAINYHRKIRDLILDIKYSKKNIINLNDITDGTIIFNEFFNINKDVNIFNENQLKILKSRLNKDLDSILNFLLH